jgi:hypothetical protein
MCSSPVGFKPFITGKSFQRLSEPMAKLRKTSYWQSFLSLPKDVHLYLNEAILSIDWDGITVQYGFQSILFHRFLIGLFSNFVFIFSQFELANEEFEAPSVTLALQVAQIRLI